MPKILLIDNSCRHEDTYRVALTRLGLDLVLVSTAREADDLLIIDDVIDFVAVLVVWEIPGPPSAVDLILRCRHNRKDLPIAVITSALDAALATRAYALGATGFLEKPLSPDDLTTCVENLLGRETIKSDLVFRMQERIRGQSSALLKCLCDVSRIIPHDDLSVLLLGESGTGKELIAREIHNQSTRKVQPWVALNVGAIPKELVESTLFGHEVGAFTGATSRRVGCFEEAGTGVLMLDEIGDLAEALQVKLLRVIQEKEFRRIGGKETLKFQARLVCATHHELADEVKRGRFRRDLYHRISECVIHIPPLRERVGDIGILVAHFLSRFSQTTPRCRLSREAQSVLDSYAFPGNVRELEHIIRAAVANCSGDKIQPTHLPLHEMGVFIGADSEETPTLDQPFWSDAWLDMPLHEATQKVVQALDRIYLPRLLEQERHNITAAAAGADIDIKTFRKRWEEAGLPPLGGRRRATREK